jgi:hypothetical protein
MLSQLIVKITSRPLDFNLRSLSIVLCLGGGVAAAVAYRLYDQVPTDGFGEIAAILLVFPDAIIALWTTIYLILDACHVNVVLPLTITFELISWAYAIAIPPLAFSMPYKASQGCDTSTDGAKRDECIAWMRIEGAMVVSCTLLLVVACVLCLVFWPIDTSGSFTGFS